MISDKMVSGSFKLFFVVAVIPILETNAQRSVLSDSCNWHYYQHYELKGCEPVLGKDGCPVRYDCKPIPEDDRKVCLHDGRRYNEGDSIETSKPCGMCFCSTNGKDAHITCAAVNCGQWEARNSSCYMGREPDKCCPKEICPSEDENKRITCSFDGKKYNIGEHIQPKELCHTCQCTEKWTGPKGPGCRKVDCLIGRYTRQLRKGCIPLHHENICCPIEIYCDELLGATPVPDPGNNIDNLCHHKGKYYQLGSKAYLKTDKNRCTTCTCAVPPDFTCEKKECPPMPNENCKASRFGPCCPIYECE